MKTGLESLDAGAPDITYEGNEGPKSPQEMQQMQMAQLQEEYDKYVFEMEEQGLEPMSIQQFMEQALAEGQMSSRGQGGIDNIAMKSGLIDEYRNYKMGQGDAGEQFMSPRDYYRSQEQDRMGVAGGGIMRTGFQGGGYDASTASFSKSYDKIHKTDTESEVTGVADRKQAEGQRKADETNRRIAASALGKTQTANTVKAIEAAKAETTLKEKYNKYTSDFRKKSILRNMFHIAKGRPIQPAIMAMLQGKMTEEDFEKKFNVSISDLVGLSPMEQTNIYGDMSQFDKDRLGEMAGAYGKDYMSQGDWTKAFYGPKGPPQLGGGGGGQGAGYMGYPSYAAWKAAQGSVGTPAAEAAEAAEDSGIPTDSVATGPISNQYHIPGASNFYSNLASNQFNPTTNMLTLADGGRIGYAGGGITDLRQGYFIGKLVKKVTKGIKKIAKSPLGKIGLMALGGWGASKMFPGMMPGLKNLWSGTKVKPWLQKSPVEGGLWNWMKDNPFPTIAGASALGGAYTAMNPEEEKDGYDYDKLDYWRKYFSDIPTDSIRFADGGRTGYAGGKDHRAAALSAMYGEDDDEDNIYKFAYGGSAGMPPVSIAPEGFNSQSFPDDETTGIAQATPTLPSQMPRPQMDPRMMAPQGMPRRMAAEGGLMDMGGMEKDYRAEGGFVPLGGEERADDVPARLSKNEFVFTADAVRNAGGGDIDRGAEVMENLMENLEQGGQVSQQSQGLEGAREMFQTQQRLGEVL